MKDLTKEFVLLRILDEDNITQEAKILRKSEVLKLPGIRATGRRQSGLEEYVQGSVANIDRYIERVVIPLSKVT